MENCTFALVHFLLHTKQRFITFPRASPFQIATKLNFDESHSHAPSETLSAPNSSSQYVAALEKQVQSQHQAQEQLREEYQHLLATITKDNNGESNALVARGADPTLIEYLQQRVMELQTESSKKDEDIVALHAIVTKMES